MEFYAAERKKELIPFATARMELESIMLNEISQGVKDKVVLFFLNGVDISPSELIALVQG